MSAAPDSSPGWVAEPADELAALLGSAGTAVGALATHADLATMADSQVAAVMDTLTTLIGQLDGLRVGVAQAVGERALYAQRGARNLTGWLRADARVADDAWKLARLAAAGSRLPKTTGLLRSGAVSLGQAATACWQIGQLPEAPRRQGQAGSAGATGEPHPADGAGSHDSSGGDPDSQSAAAIGGAADPGGGLGDDPKWAGLWRVGDLHAAADELFWQALPGLDSAQLRQLGAHLREAAAPEQRAGKDVGDFARRGLRISRSLRGCAEITGRLHAEAAEQVIAAFEELGAKTGPADTRTKAQRWADALTRLCSTATTGPPPDRPRPAARDDGTGHHHQGCQAGPRPTASPGGGTAPHGHGPQLPAAFQRPRLTVTVPLATLLGQPLAPGATVLGPGTPLAGETARRLACDDEIIRLVTHPAARGGPPGGSPPGATATGDLADRLAAALAQLPPPLAAPSAALDIGRASPRWTARQRDALFAQHGGRCAHPGCTGPIDVIHHLTHWADGGTTTITNGHPTCLFHHWLIHEGGWRILTHPDGTVTAIPPPPGWRPGTTYRHGTPVPEHSTSARPPPEE